MENELTGEIIVFLMNGQLCLGKCERITDDRLVLTDQVFSLVSTEKPGEVGIGIAFPSDSGSTTYVQKASIQMCGIAPSNLANIYRQATSGIVAPNSDQSKDILAQTLR